MSNKIVNMYTDPNLDNLDTSKNFHKDVFFYNQLYKESRVSISKGTIDSNYPISNLFSYKRHKELVVDSAVQGDSSQQAEIKISKTGSFGEIGWWFSHVIVQFNNFNQDYLQTLFDNDIRFEIEIENDASGDSYVYRFDFNESADATPSVTTAGQQTIYQDNRFNFKDGFISLSKEFFEDNFGISGFFPLSYNIYIRSIDSTPSGSHQLRISNIILNNAITLNAAQTNSELVESDICISANLNFKSENLNNYIRNDRTGSMFIDKNNSYKTFSGQLELLSNQDLYRLDLRFLRVSKNNPFYLIPFDNLGTIEEDYLNQKFGGMYIIKDFDSISSESYDVFSVELDCEEYI